MNKILLLIFLLLFWLQNTLAEPVGTAFTYQGQLTLNGASTSGQFDFNFILFDQAQTGNIIGDVVIEDVTVTNSLFTTEIDFGDLPFMGEKSWLEIRVREGASIGGFQQLLPRQKITTAPYAIQTQFIGNDSVGSTQIIDESVTAADMAENSITQDALTDDAVGSTEIINDSVITDKISDDAVTTAKLTDNAVTQEKLASSAVGANQIISSEVQLRISETCAVGTVIQNINVDGTLECQAVEQEVTPFTEASILSVDQQRQLNRWIGDDQQLWELCYKLSVDTQTSQAFHNNCNNKGPSINIMSRSGGRIFGGYAETAWSNAQNYRGYDQSFLFVLNPTIEKFYLGSVNYSHSIYTHISYGPTFGNGFDLYINGNMQLQYCNFPYAYSCDGISDSNPNDQCSQRLCGINSGGASQNIDLAELEVWVKQN